MKIFSRNKIFLITVFLVCVLTFFAYQNKNKDSNSNLGKVKKEIQDRKEKSNWQGVADEDNEDGVVSKDEGTETKLMSSNGKVYVAFQDEINENRARIRMYDGEFWRDLADENNSNGLISGQKGGDPSLEILGDEVYVAFMDSENGKRAKAKKWSNGFWADVGPDGGLISVQRGHEPVLAWNKSGKFLYAAFAEGPEEDGECEKMCRTKVKRWDGKNWGIVGENEFITENFSTEIELAASKIDDSMYAVFENIDSMEKKIRVKKWDGYHWNDVGDNANPQGIISGIIAIKPSLAIDENDNLYVSFAGMGEKNIYVKKWNGERWLDIGGDDPVCLGKCTESSIDIDKKGNIYVAFSEFNENVGHLKKTGKSYDLVRSDMWRLRVKYFDGNAWEPLPDEKYPDGFISEGNGKADPELDISGNNLFISFTDKANRNSARVVKYSITEK